MKKFVHKILSICICAVMLLGMMPLGSLAAVTDAGTILYDAYALAEGESLSYDATLTGKITSVETPYSTQYKNITVIIQIDGYSTMPMYCYRLKGEGTENLKVGDTITVTGRITNYYGKIEFQQGCTLDNVVSNGSENTTQDTYVVAGSAGLCGSEWDGGDSANGMTRNGSVYEKVFRNVPPGEYQFKVVKNGSEWLGNGEANVMLTIQSECDVTITYDPADGSITYTGDYVGDYVIRFESIYAVGAGTDNWLNGEYWNPSAVSNIMTENNGVYSITYKNIPAGDYEFKFAADGTWTHNWGGVYGTAYEFDTYADVFYNGGNIEITLTEMADVTLMLDLTEFTLSEGGAKFAVFLDGTDVPGGNSGQTASKVRVYCKAPSDWESCHVHWWNSAKGTSVWPGDPMIMGSDGIWYADIPADVGGLLFNKLYEEGKTSDMTLPTDGKMMYLIEAQQWVEYGSNVDYEVKYFVAGSGDLCGVDWVADYADNQMWKNSNGWYEKEFRNVPAGEHHFLITDGSWDNFWGDPFSDPKNVVFHLEKAGNVFIRFDPVSEVISLYTDDKTMYYGFSSDGESELVAREDLTLTENSLWCYHYTPECDGIVNVNIIDCDPGFSLWILKNGVGSRWGSGSYPTTIEVPVTANEEYTFEIYCSTDDIYDQGTNGTVSLELTFRAEGKTPSDTAPEDVGQLLDEAYSLGNGEFLPYEVTLTGRVTKINTPYDSQYQNITVTMEVPGYEYYPIRCYRLSGEGVDALKMESLITVTGYIMNYYGTIEFEQGCNLDAILEDGISPPDDPRQIVAEAYALGENETLPYMATLTGMVVSIEEPYNEQYRNLTLTMVVAGCEDKPIVCYRLKGTDAELVQVGDIITVTGMIKRYVKTNEETGEKTDKIEFDQGCTLNAAATPTYTLLVEVPESWGSDIHVFTWEPDSFGLWPGSPMTYNGECYEITLPAYTRNLIISNTDNNYKTDDLHINPNQDVYIIVNEDCSVEIFYNHVSHSYVSTEIPASCTIGAHTVLVCEICGKEKPGSASAETTPALGHTYQSAVIKPTCTQHGYTVHTCTRCEESFTGGVTQPLGHSIVNDVSNQDATCTDDGTKTGYCVRCDRQCTVIDEGSALGHCFSSYLDDLNAGCTTDGTKTAKCDRCSETDTVTVSGSALGHQYTYGTCTNCGQVQSGFEGVEKGDVNGDGRINMGDVSKVFAHVRKKKLLATDNEQFAADANGDGKINMADVAKIFSHIRGKQSL